MKILLVAKIATELVITCVMPAILARSAFAVCVQPTAVVAVGAHFVGGMQSHSSIHACLTGRCQFVLIVNATRIPPGPCLGHLGMSMYVWTDVCLYDVYLCMER